MDGKKVFDLLKDYKTGEQWESRENGVLKYAIRKDYHSDKLAGTGQMISVLLPFSNQMYVEPLCNIEIIVKEATKLGFAVELHSSMSSHMDRFIKADRSLADKLTQEDKKYIDLHSYVSLRLLHRIKK